MLFIITMLFINAADDIMNFFFFLFSPENKTRHFMQIVSFGDNLLEMSNPVSLEKIRNRENVFNLSPAELAQRAVKVKIVFTQF